MPRNGLWQVTGVPQYTRDQVRLLAQYEQITIADLLINAIDDYYLKVLRLNPALAKFRELSRD